jgi:hypothetical protein
MRRQSLMDQVLECLHSGESPGRYFEHNARLFLEVCEAHGRTAAQHHDQLVQRFIETPSASLDEKHLEHITASGPPLEVLMAALQKLRDRRTAAPRDDIRTRHDDLETIRQALGVKDQ